MKTWEESLNTVASPEYNPDVIRLGISVRGSVPVAASILQVGDIAVFDDGLFLLVSVVADKVSWVMLHPVIDETRCDMQNLGILSLNKF